MIENKTGPAIIESEPVSPEFQLRQILASVDRFPPVIAATVARICEAEQLLTEANDEDCDEFKLKEARILSRTIHIASGTDRDDINSAIFRLNHEPQRHHGLDRGGVLQDASLNDSTTDILTKGKRALEAVLKDNNDSARQTVFENVASARERARADLLGNTPVELNGTQTRAYLDRAVDAYALTILLQSLPDATLATVLGMSLADPEGGETLQQVAEAYLRDARSDIACTKENLQIMDAVELFEKTMKEEVRQIPNRLIAAQHALQRISGLTQEEIQSLELTPKTIIGLSQSVEVMMTENMSNLATLTGRIHAGKSPKDILDEYNQLALLAHSLADEPPTLGRRVEVIRGSRDTNIYLGTYLHSTIQLLLWRNNAQSLRELVPKIEEKIPGLKNRKLRKDIQLQPQTYDLADTVGAALVEFSRELSKLGDKRPGHLYATLERMSSHYYDPLRAEKSHYYDPAVPEFSAYEEMTDGIMQLLELTRLLLGGDPHKAFGKIREKDEYVNAIGNAGKILTEDEKRELMGKFVSVRDDNTRYIVAQWALEEAIKDVLYTDKTTAALQALSSRPTRRG